MLSIVLGAPGSGKTTLVPHLRELLGTVVIDWDAFMPAVASLTGREVRSSPELWGPYSELLRSVVEQIHDDVPTVILGVCTPDELSGWPNARWILLDCADAERRRRLAVRSAADVDEAMIDASGYRGLGLPCVDSTGQTARETAIALAALIGTSV